MDLEEIDSTIESDMNRFLKRKIDLFISAVSVQRAAGSLLVSNGIFRPYSAGFSTLDFMLRLRFHS